MATASSTTSVLSWRNSQHVHSPPSSYTLCYSSFQNGRVLRTVAASASKESGLINRESEKCFSLLVNRRTVLASGISLLGFPRESLAVVKQGLLAGRIPGLSEPDEQGWRTYRRPDEKSGGHGVGWSPIIPYTFRVPQEWQEVPVSIADLGGTEIDLRFASSKEGRLFVIVAPVLRFSDDLGDDAKIEKIGPPEKVINAFGPEVIGENVEGKVLSSSVAEHEGRTYYQFELEPPHVFITATAAGNRLYLFGAFSGRDTPMI
ncbi:psbP domain-containing protein 4, chloroplastic isoform X2 [Abrus precatorius]|uniref:PsbP domain-containing protein 4, chloroplastic isoform X2 n=1 Tax=Abrus precatorius TaxID=3816 RepID=A0A8B8JLJ8_ABRPR|nr:psbP domain-containing protein 4, chloroplastic isoform X2 [Abrus precatorius]